MKVLLLALITITIFSSNFQCEKITTAIIFQSNVLDLLDPSWPKLA